MDFRAFGSNDAPLAKTPVAFLAIFLIYQLLVLRVFLQVTADERTVYHNRYFMVPGIGQRIFSQGRSNASPTELIRHLGMHQRYVPLIITIFEKSNLSLCSYLELLLLFIVQDNDRFHTPRYFFIICYR